MYKEVNEQLLLFTSEYMKQKKYWLEKLAAPLAGTSLHTYEPVEADRAGAVNRQTAQWTTELVAELMELSKNNDLSLYILLLAAVKTVLYIYTGNTDLTVISPIFQGRETPGKEPTDEHNQATVDFNRHVFIRHQVIPRSTLKEMILAVRQTVLEAYENQDYPIDKLVEILGETSPGSVNGVKSISTLLCSLENIHRTPHDEKREYAHTDADLVFSFNRSGNHIDGTIIYNTALYPASFIQRLAHHLVELAGRFKQHLNTPLDQLSILSEAETRQLLEDFNQTHDSIDMGTSLVGYLNNTAALVPDHIALVGKEEQVSYRELNRQARNFALHLVRQGIRPGQIVALMMDRSIHMLVGILGILKAGAAYLPIDSEYPEKRIIYMLQDSGAALLVSRRDLCRTLPLEQLSHLSVVWMEEWQTQNAITNDENEPGVTIHPTDLAYIIYTSGSTGKPKGVMVEHRNLYAYVEAFCRIIPITPQTTVIQQASFAFDTFVEEVFPVLLKGGKIALPGKFDILDSSLLAKFIMRHDIRVLDCSPLLLNELNAVRELKTGPQGLIFISGGDVLKRHYVDNLLAKGMIYNSYGPTETTVCATYYRLETHTSDHVPIGKPISNYKVLLLDPNNRLVPVGVPGELCISGAGVARGYLNRPELTRGSFVKPPLDPAKLLLKKGDSQENFTALQTPPHAVGYKTGDLAVWMPDGNLQFIGRLDQQVKIRGFRIELTEIENKLVQLGGIREAVVVANENEHLGKYICAYFIPGKNQDPRLIKDSLALELPAYMIPEYFVPLRQFPLTSSGKIDRKALPEPTGDRIRGHKPLVLPRTYLEQKIGEIWKNLLKIEEVGIHDDFFDLGGHSILVNQSITRMREELQTDITMKEFFEEPTIEALARRLENRQKTSRSIKPAPRDQEIPLSYQQEQLWFLQHLDPDSMMYHVPRAIRFRGELDIPALKQSVYHLIKRHEILRTVFPSVNGRPIQRILEPFEIPIPIIDLADLPPEEQPQKVSALVLSQGQRRFDLEKGPMIRITLITLSENQHILVMCEHHLIHDGWTQEVILQEFVAHYTAFVQGKPSPLPDLPIQYADFACWQRAYLSGETLQRQLDFWKEKLNGLPPLLELPTDWPRPAVLSGKGDLVEFRLPGLLSDRLREFSRQQGATLFMTMLTAFKILAFRSSGQDDICIGSGVANRDIKEIENMIGMVINTIAFRTQLTGQLTVSQALEKVKQTCLEAYQYQDTPLEKVVDAVNPQRSLSYTPLFQVLYSFMDTPASSFTLPNLELTVMEGAHNQSSKYDINIVVVTPQEMMRGKDRQETVNDILVMWEYNTDIFTEATTRRMISHYRNILEEMAAQPQTTIGKLPILDETERKQLLELWQGPVMPFSRDLRLSQLFEKQAHRTPGKIAFQETGSTGVSYLQSNENANRLAHYLRELGVTQDQTVAILMERSVLMAETILAIWKAGGAYIPLDIEYPARRIETIMADSGTSLLITLQEHISIELAESKGFRVIALDRLQGMENLPSHNPGVDIPMNSLAYVIYTSGSTGKPKGAMVEHIGMMNHIQAKINDLELNHTGVVAQNASHTFDISVWQFFVALPLGGRTVIYPRQLLLEPERFITSLQEDGINILEVVPSYLALLLDTLEKEGVPPLTLRYLLVTGEAVRPELVKQWFRLYPAVKMVNAYGPTEASDDITHHIMTQAPQTDRVPVGKPIQNTRIYIVDPSMNICPVGVKGEIWVSGVGVGRGYLKDEEKTRIAFREDPFSHEPGIRLYKTGDLGRWLPDGTIDFLGRIDYQVKIRGHRIELGEIENTLLDHPLVKEAVVVDKTDKQNNSFLAAYIVAEKDGNPDTDGLRFHLQQFLPEYMIPASILLLEKMPLTPNGKCDINTLKAMEADLNIAQHREETPYAAPRNEIEEKMTEAWQEILALKRVGIYDNYFNLGGDSIRAVQLVSALGNRGLRINVRDIFKYPTIANLSQVAQTYRLDIRQGPVGGDVPLTAIQKYFFTIIPVDRHHYNQSVMFYSEEPYDINGLTAVFNKLAEHHDALRMRYRLNPDDGTVTQVNLEQAEIELKFFDYSHRQDHEASVADMENTAQQLQAGLDLSEGPLLEAALFRLRDGDRLLIIVHHLVIDGISWRILAEDMTRLYRQYREGQLLHLPPKTHSFKDWARYVEQYGRSSALLKEKEYWQGILETGVDELPYDGDPKNLDRSTGRIITRTLSPENTEKLLHQVHRAYNTEINDILLTGLAMAIQQWCGNERTAVALEGHGREDIASNLDISRTVGWFTSIYPVVLDLGQVNGQDMQELLGNRLRSIKDTLRRIPNHGLGYGILQYITPDSLKTDFPAPLNPSIIFDYRGQVDEDLSRSGLTLARENMGLTISSKIPREYPLEISGVIVNNRLQLGIEYNPGQFEPSTIDTLLNHYLNQLEIVIRHCTECSTPRPSAGDFSYKQLSLEEIDDLSDNYNIRDIYTLSPMQEGLLYQGLLDAESTAYILQAGFRVEGDVRPGLLEQSFNHLFKRYDIFRTLFKADVGDRVLQLVQQEACIDFQFRDFSTMPRREADAALEQYRQEDRETPFDLLGDRPLTRLKVVKLEDNCHEVLWTFHHILMDGWCLNILFKEFLQVYSALKTNHSPQLQGVIPYKTYIRWLEDRDTEKDREYWQRYLSGYDAPVSLPGKKNHNGSVYLQGKVEFQLDVTCVQRLKQLAAGENITLYTLIQACWARLLSQLNHRQDVVFGQVVSGRGNTFPGIDRMVGLFINTIPKRIHWDPNQSFTQMLQLIATDEQACEAFHHYPLSKILEDNPLGEELFDHFIEFSNHFQLMDVEDELIKTGFKITHSEAFEHIHYDTAVTFYTGDTLEVLMRFNQYAFDRATIEEIASQFKKIVEEVTNNER